jgi:murein DD-endopeptidase MepM/ murein hydrolase activator NlpD
MMRTVATLIFLKLFLASLHAQSPAYPKGYFMYPLAIPPKLNANFGEMRPNHFHMGLDLYTEKRENLPIYAAAEGHVARVKIEPGGFGRAIYLDHPNGYTTLYAHMNDFMPELEKYLKAWQYEKQSWMADLEIPPGVFPVKKGQFIGYSGNTGGSQGPHVHFEIRETATDKCLNPLLFGFNIPDNVPPDLVRMAVYDRNRSTYEQSPSVHALIKKGGYYQSSGIIEVKTDKVLVSLQATDRMSGSPNPNGIYEVRLFEGDRQLGGFTLDKISYDETRYLNAHIDHRYKLSGGPYLQYVLPLPGDKLGIYQERRPGSAIYLRDSLVHEFRMEVRDPYGNRSEARFSMKRSGFGPPMSAAQKELMRAGEINVFETDALQVTLPEGSLYDSIYFNYAKRPDPATTAYSPLHDIHRYTTPVHAPFIVRIKPDKSIPYPLRDRMVIRKKTKEDVMVKKAVWELGWYAASFREFGTFQLVGDDSPPSISFNGMTNGTDASKMTRIVVTVDDDNKSLRNFRAELDGKWLMFSQKGRTYTYKMDENCAPGKHDLQVSVEDEAGNRTVRNVTFTK